MGQSALCFAFCKLQTADVLQTSFVLAHLLVDEQLHTPTGEGDPFRTEQNRIRAEWRIWLHQLFINPLLSVVVKVVF